jgi:8-oxo-dGTP pyrophosphatase MutT (NUDIX family)
MEIPECFYRISVKAFVLDESGEKFLLVRDQPGFWELPGGGLEWGEEVHTGLAREIQEEMGINVVSIKDTPKYAYTFKSMKGEWAANLVYETELEHLNFVPSNECTDAQFFTAEEAQALNLSPNIKMLLKNLLERKE